MTTYKQRWLLMALGLMVAVGTAPVWAAEPTGDASAPPAQLKVNDDEVKPDMGQEAEQPKTPPKSKLRKPKVGFKTTVNPQDMKSYHRSESGDISAQ